MNKKRMFSPLSLRTVASKVVSRTAPPCFLSENYYWSDLFDKVFTVNKQVKVYPYTDITAPVQAILSPGDSIKLYSYVNRNGYTWLMFYATAWHYDNQKPWYIRLLGQPATDYMVSSETLNGLIDNRSYQDISTAEQQAAAAAAANQDIFSKITGVLKYVLIGGLAIAAVSAYGKRKAPAV